jgi:hypothetical protein
MCANLVTAGHTVSAGDARAELERAVMQCGAQWRATLAEVAAGADILITMLPGSREVREVMAGSGGVLAAMPSTAVWVDMTSSSPAAGRELAAAARARGVGVLDAARRGYLTSFGLDWCGIDVRCRPGRDASGAPAYWAGHREQAWPEPLFRKAAAGSSGAPGKYRRVELVKWHLLMRRPNRPRWACLAAGLRRCSAERSRARVSLRFSASCGSAGWGAPARPAGRRARRGCP